MLHRFSISCGIAFDRTLLHVQKYGFQIQKEVSAKYARVITDFKKNDRDRGPRKDIEQSVIIRCKRSEFNFYKGQRCGKGQDMALASKGWIHRKSRGDYFTIFPDKELDQTEKKPETAHSFDEFPLDKTILQMLKKLGITETLEIQSLTIPKILEGLNSVVSAETGSGKTIGYLVPVIHQVLQWKLSMNNRKHNTPLALILTPTRELAVQIGIEARRLSSSLGLSTKIFTGGKTKRMLRDPPLDQVDIVVSSFGVFSKLSSVRVYDTRLIRHLVIDEADALFHETFQDKLRHFLQRIPLGDARENDEYGFPVYAQLTLVSATLPARMEEIFRNMINLDEVVHVTTANLHRILVPQKFVRIGPSEKPEGLLKYVKGKVASKKSVIVFSNSNSTADWVKLFLEECEIPTLNLSGSMPFEIRSGQYGKFINGQAMVLSTTDAASRGLDTTMVNFILNYEFPLTTADYIHRCGRTGRFGSKGESRVTNFISTPTEIRMVQKLERAVRRGKPIHIFDADQNGPDRFPISGEGEELEEPEVEDYLQRLSANGEGTEMLGDRLDGLADIPY